MNNTDIRILIQANGLKYYEVAKEVGYSDTHFSRLLRNELAPELREKVLTAIEKLAAKRGHDMICVKKIVKQ